MNYKYITSLVLLFCLYCQFGYTQSQNEKPNFLFIAIDDLNDWIGVLNGHPQVRTPNIDRLAEQGFVFANAHTQSPICNPSRTSILTGLRPGTTGIYGLAPRYRTLATTSKVVSLPQYLAQNGYHTISTGKILHGGITPEERKTEFDEWGPDGGFGPYPEEKIVQKKLDMIDNPLLDWGPFPHDSDTSILDYKVASWASDRLKELGNDENTQPFFMGVGFHKPHVPLYVSQKWFDLYAEKDIVLPPAPEGDRIDVPDFAWYLHWFLPEPRLSWIVENNEWRSKVRAYLACISFVDAQVGRVLDALETSGLAENTIVVLWSDHGYHLGEKDITGKNTLWERSTHVPLIFSGVGIPKGEKSYEAVELLDMYPTIVKLANLPVKSELEGVSLQPFFRNPNYKRELPAITTHNPGNHSIRTREWRYISYADGSEELYNMERDPYEWRNLAELHEYDSIKLSMRKWIPKNNQPLAPGSKHRILEKRDNEWYWENRKIDFKQLIK